MSHEGVRVQKAVLEVLKTSGRVDAYRAARQCQGVSVQEAGRALLALAESGAALQVEDGGDNCLASVFEQTGR